MSRSSCSATVAVAGVGPHKAGEKGGRDVSILDKAVGLEGGWVEPRRGAGDAVIIDLRDQADFHAEDGTRASPAAGRSQGVLKRAVDVALGLVLLVIFLPVMLVAALAIKLNDGGPVLFRQERVGKDGARFVLYKFRTMIRDAERHQETLRSWNQRDGGPLFKLAHDPRVTRVGRFLRASSIDELPQLVNVLTGSMSLVGPRPATPREVAQFDVQLLTRLAVLPGITGLWQIKGRDDPSFETYRRLDLFYVANRSLLLDLVILVGTVQVVLVRVVAAVFGGRSRGDVVLVLD